MSVTGELFDAPGLSGGDERKSPDLGKPLAARMRPQSIDDYRGQAHILGENKPLKRALESGHLHSMILWGPPGVGKTSLAQLLAKKVSYQFIALSAVLSGVKEIRGAISQAQQFKASGKRTLLFIDEVHRFNKSQQDAFLPYVEEGLLTFIGATTENPSFEVNNALLSRCRIYVLKSLESHDLKCIINAALRDRARGLGNRNISVADDALAVLVQAADGDARRVLNLLEIASDLVDDKALMTLSHVEQIIVGSARRFDKGGDMFYEQISALHKSVRGSDPDAALYWFARMLDGGCDPLYIARRLVRMSSEDIGNADPRALQITLDAWRSFERLGSPEGELALAQAVVYLASAPKSNATYEAYKSVISQVKTLPSFDVPMHLRNAPTEMMKSLEYGKDYRYAHSEEAAFAAGEKYFPDEMASEQYYFPVERGLEIKISEKLRRLRALNERAKKE